MDSHEKPPDEVLQMFEKYFALINQGICPHCKDPIESKKQVGRCVYALPCSHRLFQGKLPTKGKHELKEHPYLREQREREEREQGGRP